MHTPEPLLFGAQSTALNRSTDTMIARGALTPHRGPAHFIVEIMLTRLAICCGRAMSER
jgi:hypothetical protein